MDEPYWAGTLGEVHDIAMVSITTGLSFPYPHRFVQSPRGSRRRGHRGGRPGPARFCSTPRARCARHRGWFGRPRPCAWPTNPLTGRAHGSDITISKHLGIGVEDAAVARAALAAPGVYPHGSAGDTTATADTTGRP
jgi:hypothetical protein